MCEKQIVLYVYVQSQSCSLPSAISPAGYICYPLCQACTTCYGVWETSAKLDAPAGKHEIQYTK